MAARQALECEEDHFDPVIKITNCLRARRVPCAGMRGRMGGRGSGGHNSKGKLRDVQCARLDVHELARDGNLTLGKFEYCS